MDYLPLFAELKQRPVLVIGGDMTGLATGGVAQRAECGGGGENKTGAERQRKQTAAQRGKHKGSLHEQDNLTRTV